MQYDAAFRFLYVLSNDQSKNKIGFNKIYSLYKLYN